MKVTTSTVFDILSRLRLSFQRNNAFRNEIEEPLRSELYSSEQMNRHGKTVARSHKLQTRPSSDQLLKRLDDNERTLLEVRNLLVESIRSGKSITPAAEWLLDNFYLIEEQVVIAGKHLPKGYSEGLPCLAEGISAGLPRVYDLVLEIISHSDGRVDVKSLGSFITSYQTHTQLTLGELWAIPIMLRLAVIENLRRIAGNTALDMIDHNLADYWADRMTTTVAESPADLILTIADMARSKPVLDSSFVAGFTRQLQGKGPVLALPLSWMEQQLSGSGVSSNELVRQENQKQAADQVSVRNSIGTLRFLGATDWRDFVEDLSSVEAVLRQDHSGTYPLMDFSTRDRYRHVVEMLAKHSALSETAVAEKVLELTNTPVTNNKRASKRRHVGYYLVDKGLPVTEQAINVSYTALQRLTHAAGKVPVSLYLLGIITLTLFFSILLGSLLHTHGIGQWQLLCFAGLLSLSGSLQLSVSLVNWLSTLLIQPRLLPRMDFSGGIPVEYRTLVIVPTMLSGKAYIEELVEALEIRFLANKEAHLHFGLLTDFIDAPAAVMPDDSYLLAFAQRCIAALNEKYPQPDHDSFFLFHRNRTWNAQEQQWMGHERKRGKLAALNAFLRGRDNNAFSAVTGRYEVLMQAKYVITLDSDTQLPREAVWKFIATMAHPLNQAVYNMREKRVTEGYGILQPRVASGIPKAAPTLYLRMQGDVAGIDPYTQVSSDVYQDLFKEGSFIGKGIYDIDIFEQSLQAVLPENRILSHDLLEGCYARSGMLSDVLVYEDNPAQYAADVKRHHRWIRGDWQIGAWMLPFVTGGNGRLQRNKLSGLSRWKIADNLRRSLLPQSLLLLLLAGWTVLPFPWFWTLAVTTIILLPVLAAAGWQFLHKPADLNFQAHLSETGISVRDTLLRFIFGIAVLPYQAFVYTDAIIRTNWRMIVSHKKLLQWTPSAQASRKTPNTLRHSYTTMWFPPLLALLFTALFLYTNTAVLYVAGPMLLLWLLAPALSWRLSLPETEKPATLSATQTLFLHQSARKTWLFFEQFVTASENWLPPDNYQEQPVAVIAHRTSPTNLGLALLANLTAYDFGYITGSELLIRCRNTLQSMQQLERHKGHFYNWYDTLSLLPLPPRYVSTVDSGNLAGHLLTLKQGLLALSDAPVFGKRNYQGLHTTASLVLDAASGRAANTATAFLSLLPIAEQESDSLSAVKKHLDTLSLLAEDLATQASDQTTDMQEWSDRLVLQLQQNRSELETLVPWLPLLPLPEAFAQFDGINTIPSFLSIRALSESAATQLLQYEQQQNNLAGKEWLSRMRTALAKAPATATAQISLLTILAEQCEELSMASYDFLFDKSTSLLSIGYNIEEQRKDDSYYDLLASEARLGVFVAIAQGSIPQESWFALGRLLTNSGGDPILLSWSGSMFEYLMPQLVMPAYENTLLYQTSKATVKRQIEYAAQRGIPWGISESAYNIVDANFNYQYRAFGVPGLGLKRGLEEDLVIAPYASMLALMVLPEKACSNLQLLANAGFEGRYGFYEAIDYTVSRLPRGKTLSIIPSFMVHHQGMGFLSLAYLLLDKPMQQRFTAELRFQATLLLLQERIPRATVFYAHTADLVETHTTIATTQVRKVTTAATPLPEVHLLSNGRYQVMITNSGGGYSRWKNLAVTRWREDTTRDHHGLFCYIKDVQTGHFWSNTLHPTLQPAKGYEAIFSLGHVEFHRQDYGLDTKTEIVISPEDDTEMRRVSITNRTQQVKILELTSYAEIVMASQASDESHPAFSNLFVQTEIRPEHKAIVCTRRARSATETPPWLFHLMDVHGATAETVSYETDRMQFVGRGNTLAHPQAMDVDALSGNQGSVLDPILSIRYRISIKPGQTAKIDLIYGISETKEACEGLIFKYRDQHLRRRAFELSWTHSQVLLRQINATEADAQLYDRLAASVIYANSSFRAEAGVLLSNRRGQSGLWSHSVSGDLPIVLLHVYNTEHLELVKQIVQAHAYWRLKGLAVDLVIWNEDYGSYRQELQEQILGLISSGASGYLFNNKPGSVFVKSADQISTEDRTLFESVARVILYDNKGSLSEQMNAHYTERNLPALLETKQAVLKETATKIKLPDSLLFFNGTGGFTPDGQTYQMLIDQQATTPAPWVNVIANAHFGTVLSESGSAYTWAINAHEYRITPWSNDPVSDEGGEAFYLRDEETGYFWSPCPYPAKGATPYIVTHGFGYSKFEHTEQGINSTMSVFVDKDLPVKFVTLTIRNQSGRERKFSATGFLEIILGDVRSKTNMHVISEQDAGSGALLFRNYYNSSFTDRVSFFKTNGTNPSITADRGEFIGRNHSLNDPQALYRKRLSGKTGAGMDTCAALQAKFDLLDGEEKEIIFQIGSGENTQVVLDLIRKFNTADAVTQSLQAVQAYWKEITGAVQVSTPDPALNMLANGWLIFQTMACRIFARSGFYQSGGAFGFRDQLQDVLALLHTTPQLARDQILLSASRQFTEGDVQHWWHPPEGRGVRTHCSDDLLWLPFAVSRYMSATGDTSLLTTTVGFLESRLLRPEEDSLYDLPMQSQQSGTIYEHCVRAIQHSLRFGAHGLPFIGAGDWNDGMDQVGHKGAGESVWLAFFLYDVLHRFSTIADAHNDEAFADRCRQQAATLQSNIEASAWDGAWYLRAWFDDGMPLGSAQNTECRIDAIAQSWAVLSGAGDETRTNTALASLNQHLVRRDLQLIQLLEPAFNGEGPNPGYISGYVPGVRENGGQYSHAAIWALMAFAAKGDRDKVWELFSMIQPIHHSSNVTDKHVYKAEPYVMAADVYANESHKGRGGWTWYTGSAGWMYQFITGSLLGMTLLADRLQFKPCFPQDWPSVSIVYRYRTAVYNITVYQVQNGKDSYFTMDNSEGEGDTFVLTDDGLLHNVQVYIQM